MSVEKETISEKVKAEEIKFDRESCSGNGPRIEGYWASSWTQSLLPWAYPWPKEHDESFPGETDFVKKLENIEKQIMESSVGTCLDNDGSSLCRVCGKENGSAEYFLNKYSWPSGFKHYVEKHHVIPSREFYTFIKGLPEKEVEPKQEYLTGSKDWFF